VTAIEHNQHRRGGIQRLTLFCQFHTSNWRKRPSNLRKLSKFREERSKPRLAPGVHIAQSNGMRTSSHEASTNQHATRKAVLLVNLGSPDSPSVPDVRRFEREHLMDRRVTRAPWPIRCGIVNLAILPMHRNHWANAYRSIWTNEGSPMVVTSRRVCAALQRHLKIPVELAMRYQHPSINSAVEKLAKQGIDELLLIPLFPHDAVSSYETIVECVKDAVHKLAPHMHLHVQPPYYDAPDYIDALLASAKPYLRHLGLLDLHDPAPAIPTFHRGYEHLLFSFRGLSEREMNKADKSVCRRLNVKNCCAGSNPAHATCYRAQCFKTARAFINQALVQRTKYSVAFQSHLGPDPWMQPCADREIERLARAGVKRLLVICPSFVADCLETLDEIRMRGRERFLHAGGEELTLIPCLDEHPRWIDALQRMVTTRWPEAAVGKASHSNERTNRELVTA
jgi:protoporphyrin/coproporphyrin ferrochelatase